MSQGNIDLVLAAYEWGNRERRLARHLWHDDGVYVNATEDPDHATHRGVEAIEALFASWIASYPDVTVEPLETQAHGDRLLVWVRFAGTAATSGVPLTMEMAHVITIEDGRVLRLEEYFDRTQALRALGSSPEAR
jgi:ketosteroid isomerase-like protein